MFDNLPAALLALFLAVCVLWLVWRALRRLLSPRRTRLEPSLAHDSGSSRIEPSGSQAGAAVSTIPDAADVLALKAAIDNLARQVAALEKRLAAGQPERPTQVLPDDRTVEPSPMIPPVSPDHRI